MRYFTGYFGELLVLIYFKIKWYNIVKHRYRCRFGEIDLIISKGEKLIFLEVKTSLFGHEIPLSSAQCQSIVTSSKYFLSKNSNFLEYSIRYDLCWVSLNVWNLLILIGIPYASTGLCHFCPLYHLIFCSKSSFIYFNIATQDQ